MKSIKLKAEEHLRENNITQYEYKSYIEGADFGANYVLEQVEKLICQKHVEGNLPLFDLTRFIDKLKEK
jgi:hypothetical protein